VSYSRPQIHRSDNSQAGIVEAIQGAGWSVWIIGRPVDLLCWRRRDGFRLLECKTAYGKQNPKAVIDKRQKEQIEFIELTGTPRVTSPIEALLALGEKVELLP
jgi:hypothetical protein